MELSGETGIVFILALAFALFVGGTPALVSAIYFAVAGEIHPGLLLFLTILTTVVWDTIWYLVGHKLVSLDRMRTWRVYNRNAQLYEHMLSIYQRRHYTILFFSRFMYGTSTVCAVIAGVFKMNYGLYLGTCALSITGQFAILYAISRGIHEKIASLGGPYAFVIAIIALVAIVALARYGARKFFDRYTS